MDSVETMHSADTVSNSTVVERLKLVSKPCSVGNRCSLDIAQAAHIEDSLADTVSNSTVVERLKLVSKPCSVGNCCSLDIAQAAHIEDSLAEKAHMNNFPGASQLIFPPNFGIAEILLAVAVAVAVADIERQVEELVAGIVVEGDSSTLLVADRVLAVEANKLVAVDMVLAVVEANMLPEALVVVGDIGSTLLEDMATPVEGMLKVVHSAGTVHMPVQRDIAGFAGDKVVKRHTGPVAGQVGTAAAIEH